MTDSRVRVDVGSDETASVFLDYPARHNVLDQKGWEDLASAFQSLSQNQTLRCVIVRGVGGRAFSAGSDIGAFGSQRSTTAQVKGYGRALHGALQAITDCPYPTVAAIEGICVGGGLEISSCCDLRICSASSVFGAPINRLGLTMAFEELEPLVGLLGPGPVLELLLTGDMIDSLRAHSLGLVNRVFPDESFQEEADLFVGRIVAGAPLVNRWHKRFIRRLGREGPLSDEERNEGYEAFTTDDYREGREAFLEKRPPRFKGR